MPVKSVPIKLDRMRQLCFNFTAIGRLQREHELNISDFQKFINIALATKEGKTKGFVWPVYELQAFLWAGLLKETPDITFEEVGELLDDHMTRENAKAIGESLAEAIIESMFFKEARKKAVRPRPRSGSRKSTSKKTTI